MREREFDPEAHVIDYVRKRYPGTASRVDHERRPTDAIRLFCRACQGGSRSAVITCEVEACFLWPYRDSSAEVTRSPACPVPSVEEYSRMAGPGNPENLPARE